MSCTNPIFSLIMAQNKDGIEGMISFYLAKSPYASSNPTISSLASTKVITTKNILHKLWLSGVA
jgi:hypothetical protein